jgi:LDH2 family malate/lactate/ureidoglycolate dehydrogenase
MATSVVARGKIIMAAQRGEAIPEGWAVDASGAPTTDAQAALEGSVLPFGGPKGYGIAMMVEVMAGILTGASFGPAVGDLYENMTDPQGNGAFLNLLDVSAFLPYDEFTARMEMLIDQIKATGSPTAGREVLVPGEIEERMAQQRSSTGIPLSPDLVASLDHLAPQGSRLRPKKLTEEL